MDARKLLIRLADESPQILVQAWHCQTPEDLRKLAADNGIKLSPDEADALYNTLHRRGPISDAELAEVTDGTGGTTDRGPLDDFAVVKCPKCHMDAFYRKTGGTRMVVCYNCSYTEYL